MQKNNSFNGRSQRSRPNSNFKPSGRSGGFRARPSRGPRRQTIHPSKFINRASTSQQPEQYEPRHVFSDFALNSRLQNSLNDSGFKVPSAIQDQALEIALRGQDVIGLADTGSGKTAAFLLPMLEKLYANRVLSSALIIAPTRELAQQINEQFQLFSRGMKLYSSVCVGGTNIDKQIREIRRGPHVIIGTPGRLKDLLNRKILRLDSINTFVLDEADRMLDMGFLPDIKTIAAQLPKNRQTLCFSATMTPTIAALVNDFMVNPTTISVRSVGISDQIDQDVVEARDKAHKTQLLEEMLVRNDFEKVLVFGETKYGVQRLANHLSGQNIPSEAIHGNKSQSQRQRALRAFKTNAVKVLVATDVAARGLDIPNVSHVINFDQPQSFDDYVHRIGRTGRAGKTGKALTFIDQRR